MFFFHGIGPPIYQWHKMGERGKEGERGRGREREKGGEREWEREVTMDEEKTSYEPHLFIFIL